MSPLAIEVWTDAKKRRLIDTILRDWHVPPIHVIELKENSKHIVLDGQQRLVAIRDFVNGVIKVDGNIEPLDPAIQALNGLRFSQLPQDWKRKFNQFTIRVFRIIDFKPEEPAEIFYRLNQPTNLTAAEQRNAFFGPAREQVKLLVGALEQAGGKEFVGFSNSRMAYDDALSRLCLSLELNTLHEKVTAAALADRYRRAAPFDDQIVGQVVQAIKILAQARGPEPINLHFNKAALFSWMWFIIRSVDRAFIEWTPDHISQFFRFFDACRRLDGPSGESELTEKLKAFASPHLLRSHPVPILSCVP